jgi:hypothetical protein
MIVQEMEFALKANVSVTRKGLIVIFGKFGGILYPIKV